MINKICVLYKGSMLVSLSPDTLTAAGPDPADSLDLLPVNMYVCCQTAA